MNAYAIPGIQIAKDLVIDPMQAVEIILMASYQTTLEQICIKSRRRNVVHLRQVVQTCLARHTRMPLSEIGRMTGLRDHCTVIHSRNQVEDAEYCYKQMHFKSDLFKLYTIFEMRYKSFMEENHVKVVKHYRSYQEELKCTR
jgi:hypothetical protein